MLVGVVSGILQTNQSQPVSYDEQYHVLPWLLVFMIYQILPGSTNYILVVISLEWTLTDTWALDKGATEISILDVVQRIFMKMLIDLGLR